MRLSPARAGAVAIALAVAVGAACASGASARELGPGDHYETLTVDGLARDFVLHVPPGAAVSHRPLILVYHGRGGTAQSTEQETDFASVADRTGEVVAFLQGVDDSWNEQAGGSTGAARAKVNDVAYTSDVISEIEQLVPFDRDRIVAAGFSNGAEMVEDLGCKLAGTLALIVPVEGELPKTVAARCAPRRPIAVYEIHGTADTAIPYDGGPILGRGVVVLSAPQSAARWASLDRCAHSPTTSSPSPSIELATYHRCRREVTVTLRTIVGGVHQWGSNIAALVTAALPRP